jgi:protein-S-isoprenylcysteine O-methyltransferase Ste14
MTPRHAIAGAAPLTTRTHVWRKVLRFCLHRRVRITAILFVLLIIEDVSERIVPHNLANFYDYKVLLGLSLIVFGLALRSWAAGTLHKRAVLTTSGPYGLVRHPLYIGSFAMMVGFCELIDDAENIWFVFGPILALYVYRAIHEERVLAGLFPNEWVAYARRVPRFFPRRWPKELFAKWNLKQWLLNREYQAVSAAIVGLIALQMMQIMNRP